MTTSTTSTTSTAPSKSIAEQAVEKLQANLPATKSKAKADNALAPALKAVEALEVFKVDNIVTAGKHLRSYWIASMQVSGAWNGAEKGPKAFHWALASKTAFSYHQGKGNIVAGAKGGYKLVQKGKAVLMDKAEQALIDGYKALMETGKAPNGFKPATVKGAPVAIRKVRI
jgi:hypothetical protein